MSNLIWVHDASLRASHPVFQVAGADAKCVFIWDKAYFKDCNIGFNRLAFVLEALGLMDVAVYEGATLETLKTLCEGWGVNQVVVAETLCPHLNCLINQLKVIIAVTVVPDVHYSPVRVNRPAIRFFSYWKQVKPIIYRRIWRSKL